MKLFPSLAAVLFAFTLPVTAQTFAPQEGPQAILPMNKVGKMVEFDHTRHQDLPCATCHHENDPSETFQPYQCSSCHSTDKNDKKLDNSYFQIIHGKKAKDGDAAQRCLACHIKEHNQGNIKEDITSCSGSSCHK